MYYVYLLRSESYPAQTYIGYTILRPLGFAWHAM